MQRSRASAMVNEWAHRQPAGRCSVHCRAEWVSRPGSASKVRRRVLATVCWSPTPKAEGGDPADEVVGQGGGQQPRAVGGELPGGQVGQARARLEVADGQLADGVAAMVGVQPGHGAGPVGDEGVVAPGGEQLGLLTLVADATHDQPVALVAGLGDLGGLVGLVGDRDPGRLGNGGDGGADRLGLADRDRVAHPVAAQPPDELG